MFSQKNDDIMFGCIYHSLSLYIILYAPVHFVHYTSIIGTDEERMTCVSTYIQPDPQTLRSALLSYIPNLFYIHNILTHNNTSFLCIVHIGTKNMHAYTCILLSTVFLHSQLSPSCLQALVLL